MINKLTKIIEEKNAEVAELKKELTKLNDLLAKMEAQATIIANQPQVAATPEFPAYMEPTDLEMPGPKVGQ